MREIFADYCCQRMRANSRDQRRASAEEGEGGGSVGRRTTGRDHLRFDGDLLIAARDFVDGVADVDRRQSHEEAGGAVIVGCGVQDFVEMGVPSLISE